MLSGGGHVGRIGMKIVDGQDGVVVVDGLLCFAVVGVFAEVAFGRTGGV